MKLVRNANLGLFVFILLFFGKSTWAASEPKKGFNPDISANFLGLFSRGTNWSNDRNQKPHNGFSLQEAEFQFNADVDPYFKSSLLFAIAQESGSADFKLDPEEVFIETLQIPSLTLKLGKFKTAFGKHNALHTHAFPFIDAPLIHQQLLGDEGLNEVGASAAYLMPASWYSEVTFQVFTASNSSLYGATAAGDLAGVFKLKNLWDLSSDFTMELGLSGTMGKNAQDRTASAYAADLTFKWRPSEGGKYKAWIWSTEYLAGNRPGFTDSNGNLSDALGGIATWMQYQMSERWWIEGRFEVAGIPRASGIASQTKQSALIGFFPSEFSGLRLQYDHLNTQFKSLDDHAIAFQYNISIGAHPAHAY